MNSTSLFFGTMRASGAKSTMARLSLASGVFCCGVRSGRDAVEQVDFDAERSSSSSNAWP